MDQRPKCRTTKLIEENIGRTLFDINHSKIFFDPPPRVIEIKTKTNGRLQERKKDIQKNKKD